MIADSFATALRAFCRRRPFRPFVLELITGERIRIVHPELMVLRGGVAVYIGSSNSYQLFDSTSVLRLLEVESNSEGEVKTTP